MKKLFLLTIFLMITMVTLGEESKGILYKATKGNKIIYLFENQMANEESNISLSSNVQEIYNNSKTVIMRSANTPLLKEELDTVNDLTQKNITYSSGKIEDRISKEGLELLNLRLSEVGIPFYNTKIKPWGTLFFLYTEQLKIVYKEIPKYYNFSTENKNVKYAMGNIDAFKKLIMISDEDFVSYLQISLDEIKKYTEVKILAWKNGDEENLYKSLRCLNTEYDYNYLKEKNDKFMIVINQEIKNIDELFVVADEGQIVLDNSLKDRLESEGYKIERVN